MNKYKSLLIALVLPIFMLVIGLPAFADDNESNNDSSQSEAAKKAAEAKREAAKQAAEAKREAAKQAAEEKREVAKNELEQKKEKLKEDKLKICQGHEDRINDSMGRAASRGQEKINLFSKIAERTEAFYVLKGKVLVGYDDLVAALNSQKAAAQAAVDTVKAGSDDFKCDGDNPKAAAKLFKIDVQAMNDALKDYRTAVKNLIVGVKSVQATQGDN